jgi:hypothetical protein
MHGHDTPPAPLQTLAAWAECHGSGTPDTVKKLDSSSGVALSNNRQFALKSVDFVLNTQLELLQFDFLNLLLFGEIRLLQQFLKPLSVAMMFGLQAIDFFTQRGILYFVHQAPPSTIEHLGISPRRCKQQAQKKPKVT